MKKWLIIGIILLVVILISVYFYNKSKKTSSTTNISSGRKAVGTGVCQKCVSKDDKGNCTQWMDAPCNDLAFSV